jgi:hypothetical protein
MSTNPDKPTESDYPGKQEPTKYKTHQEWIDEGFKPGEALPNGGWLGWDYSDIDKDDTVTFTPKRLMCTINDIIKLDVNGLVIYFKAEQEVTIPRFFYNVYKDLEDGETALEDLKRHGPRYKYDYTKKYMENGELKERVYWRAGDLMVENWQYTPEVEAFGMDINGQPYRPDKYEYEFDSAGIPSKVIKIVDAPKPKTKRGKNGSKR